MSINLAGPGLSAWKGASFTALLIVLTSAAFDHVKGKTIKLSPVLFQGPGTHVVLLPRGYYTCR
jgi:hypothetical protein